MSKEILVLKSSTKSYKTTAIGEVFNKIQRNISLNCRIVTPSPPSKNYPFTPFSSVKKDFTEIIEITGKKGKVKVGINSAGDVVKQIEDAINTFIANSCDIIIAASRTRGRTWSKIKAYKGYPISIFDYTLDPENCNIIINGKAELIYERLLFLI